ncbi:MAG: hypothetical protein Q4C52_06150 [Eubacteriales bacterium]|nr:hypothetical protein [Eubacteriales bacterium]
MNGNGVKNGVLKKPDAGRMFIMITGIILIGMGVASYRISLFGVDAFTCMNLGISGFIGISFGNWQLIMNVFLLIAVFFTVRNCIGPGTVVNMVFVGYIADFCCWLIWDVLGINAGLSIRVLFLCVGTLFASLGCAWYMTADLGIAPYDSVALIIMKFVGNKISFRMARVASDVTVILAGVIFCILARNNVWEIIGVGTIVNAFCNGPLIQLFQTLMKRTFKNIN